MAAAQTVTSDGSHKIFSAFLTQQEHWALPVSILTSFVILECFLLCHCGAGEQPGTVSSSLWNSKRTPGCFPRTQGIKTAGPSSTAQLCRSPVRSSVMWTPRKQTSETLSSQFSSICSGWLWFQDHKYTTLSTTWPRSSAGWSYPKISPTTLANLTMVSLLRAQGCKSRGLRMLPWGASFLKLTAEDTSWPNLTRVVPSKAPEMECGSPVSNNWKQ